MLWRLIFSDLFTYDCIRFSHKGNSPEAFRLPWISTNGEIVSPNSKEMIQIALQQSARKEEMGWKPLFLGLEIWFHLSMAMWGLFIDHWRDFSSSWTKKMDGRESQKLAEINGQLIEQLTDSDYSELHENFNRDQPDKFYQAVHFRIRRGSWNFDDGLFESLSNGRRDILLVT